MALEIPNVLGTPAATPPAVVPVPGSHPHVAELLSRLAPILAATVAAHQGGPQAATGLLQGFQKQQIVHQEKQKDQQAIARAQQQQIQARTDRLAQETLQRGDKQAEFRVKALETLASLDDPAVFTQVARQLDDIGATQFQLPPGTIKNSATFSDAAKLKKDQKDAQTLMDTLAKQYGAREIFDTNPTVTFHGQPMKYHDLVDLAGLTARVETPAPGQSSGPAPKPVPGADGRMAPPATKPIPVTGSETERAAQLLGQIRAAKQAGDVKKTSELQAEYDDLVAVRKTFGDAGRKPDAPATGTGGLTEDGSDYAATVFRVTGKMPALGNGGQAMKTAIINKAAAQAKLLGQSPAVSIQKQAAYKADTSALTKMKTMSAAAESFETKALAQAEIVSELSNKVSRTQYPIINRALLAGEAHILGDQNVQLLYNAVATFTTEYAKIMEGSSGSAAGSSDSARRAAAELISAALNKGTLQATIDLMKREMGLTIDGYAATINHITEQMGGAPAAATPAPAATAPSAAVPSYQDYLAGRQGAKK